ncbi:MAG: hypothetical protein IKL24_03630 [Clostridia bacterium]|nr:hypothetical protein [Clostridia bacterium]
MMKKLLAMLLSLLLVLSLVSCGSDNSGDDDDKDDEKAEEKEENKKEDEEDVSLAGTNYYYIKGDKVYYSFEFNDDGGLITVLTFTVREFDEDSFDPVEAMLDNKAYVYENEDLADFSSKTFSIGSEVDLEKCTSTVAMKFEKLDKEENLDDFLYFQDSHPDSLKKASSCTREGIESIAEKKGWEALDDFNDFNLPSLGTCVLPDGDHCFLCVAEEELTYAEGFDHDVCEDCFLILDECGYVGLPCERCGDTAELSHNDFFDAELCGDCTALIEDGYLCFNCEETFDSPLEGYTVEETGEVFLCDACFGDICETCPLCGEDFLQLEYNDFLETDICADCNDRMERGYICYYCGEEFNRRLDKHTFDGVDIYCCDTCFEDNYDQCYMCEEYFDDTVYVDGFDVIFCEDCYEVFLSGYYCYRCHVVFSGLLDRYTYDGYDLYLCDDCYEDYADILDGSSFSAGEVFSNGYENSFISLGITLDADDWTILNGSQLADLNGIDEDFGTSAYNQELKSIQGSYLFMAQCNTNASIVITGHPNFNGTPDDDDIRSILETSYNTAKPSLEGMGYTNLNYTFESLPIAGGEYTTLYITAKAGSVELHMAQFICVGDEYIAAVTVSGTSVEELASYLLLFYTV